MSLSQWDIFTDTAETQITFTNTLPILDGGSFLYHKNAVGWSRVGAMRRNVVGQRYLNSGAIQSVWEGRTSFAAGFNTCKAGVIFLMQQDQGPHVAGSDFYLAGYHTNGNSNAGAWGVYRFTNGSENPPTTLQNGPSTPAVALNTPFTLDVEWQQDPVEIGGVRIIMKVGSALDFSDLVTVCDVVDAAGDGALMGDSFGEGLGLAHHTAGSAAIDIVWDRIRGYSVAPA